MIVDGDDRPVAVACDRLIGEEQIVVKSLALPGVTASGYIGAAILGDGQIALILDPHSLTESRRGPGREREGVMRRASVRVRGVAGPLGGAGG